MQPRFVLSKKRQLLKIRENQELPSRAMKKELSLSAKQIELSNSNRTKVRLIFHELGNWTKIYFKNFSKLMS